MKKNTTKTKNSKEIAKRGIRKDVDMFNAARAEAAVVLKSKNEKMISAAIRNPKTPLGRTIGRILRHSQNKGKSPEDILEILAKQTRKGKGGEALVAASFNADAFKKGRLHPHQYEPGDIFARVGKRNVTGRDVIVYEVNKHGKSVEIHSQEIKTGSKGYAEAQSRSGKYKDVVTNKENLSGKVNGKIKGKMKVKGVESKKYTEKKAIDKTKKTLVRQYKNKRAVTALDEAKFLAKESTKAGVKSAAISGVVTVGMDLGGDLLSGNKIDKKRIKDVGKNAVKGAAIAGVDTAAKTIAAKTVSKTLSSKGGQAVIKKIAGKGASKVLGKNVGKIAGPAGGFVVDSVVDVVQVFRGKQSIGKASVNVGLNAANATLYVFFPPAAIGMTIVRIGGSIIWGW